MPSKPPRKLPVLVERSVREVDTLRTDLANKFEMKVRLEVAQSKRAVTCRAGCAWCCYHPVMISILEGVTIYRWLQRKGKWTDALKKKLKETSDRQYGTAFETWLFSMIACPLLDEKNRCAAYESRPLICRSYYATSDPYACHPHRLGEGTEIVDRSDATDIFYQRQEDILRKHKVQFISMPVGTALLYAERICTGDLDLASVDVEVLRKYAENG